MKTKWIILIISLLFSAALHSQKIIKAEYFYDTDPGQGNGTPISFTAPGDSVLETLSLNTTGLSSGYHKVIVRVMDSTNVWSIAAARFFMVAPQFNQIQPGFNPQPPSKIVAAEYFYDADPGVGNGTPLSTTSGDSILQTFNLNTFGLIPGYHKVIVRVQDSLRRWSIAATRIFMVAPDFSQITSGFSNLPAYILAEAEYFFDNDPGPGNGIPLTFPLSDSINQNFNLPLTGLDSGYHFVCIRVKDSIGRWGIFDTDTFTILGCESPVSNFSCPTDICIGDTLNITNTTTGTDQWIGYDWDMNGDGTSEFSANGDTSFLFSSPGTYNIKLKATNSSIFTFGCRDSIIKTVTVHDLPQAVVIPYGPTNFCQGEFVSLVANYGAGYTYQWMNNNTVISGATSSLLNAYNAGNYSTEVTSFFGCVDTSSVTTVSVNALPGAIITPSGPTSFCQGSSVILNANTGTALSYVWRKNGNIISGQTTSSIIVTESGTYIVEITNSNNCTSVSSPITTTVNTIPNAAIIPGGLTTFCQGGILALNATLGSGYTYEWLNNGSTVSGIITSAYNVSQSGSYQVVITSTNQCSDTSSLQTVTVNPIPGATITASGPISFCQGETVTLNANTGTGLTYVWKKNGNILSGQTSASLIVSDAGNYLVEISNSYNCTTVSNSIVITVNPIPNATITVGGASTICQGDVLQLYGTSGTGYSYQWLNNGSPISGSTSLFHTITQSGNYQVVVTSATLCSDTSAVEVITVNPAPTSAFSLVGSSVFCQGDSVLLDAIGSTANTYQWKSYGINIPSATDSFHYVYQTGNFSLVTTNSYNCSTESNAQQITVNTVPGASILPLSSTTFCDGDSVKLQANIGTGLSYQWFKNNVLISGAINSQYVVYNSGAYTVEVGNAANCSSLSAAANVTVYAVPTASFSMQSIACKSDTVSIIYNGTASAGAFYNWNFSSGIVTSGNGQGPYKVIWNNPGFKNVSLTVNENGCVSPLVSQTIEIKSVTANITAPNTTVCAGDSVFLYANAGQNLTYQWYQGGLPLAGETNALMAATTSGNYTVLVTNPVIGCSQFSSIVQVNVHTTNFNLDFAATPASFSQLPFNTVFTNSTPNMNNYLFLWDFGDGTTSSFYQPFHQYLYNGSYTVSLFAENTITGCRDTLVKPNYVTCAGGAPNPCNILAAITPAGPATICFNDSIMLTASSGTNYTYQWTFNGVILPGADSIVYYAKHNGTYRVIISDTICSQTSPPFVLNHYPSVLPIIQVNGAILPCTNDSLELFLGSYYNNYLWSTNETSNSIWVNQTGYYTVTVTDNYNCVIPSPQYTVNTSFLQPPEVCIVGVDTNNYNRVIWEKPPSVLIDSFYIYREGTIAGQYDKIGVLPYNAPGIFSDTNSNPQIRSYRYKLAAKDTCGGQTLLSDFHKSIHLTINAGLNGAWNLIWDGYVGFPFGSYIIYRGSTTSNMTLLTQLPSTLSSYTDLNPPSGTVYYQIEVLKVNGCYPDSIFSKINTNYNSSRSNHANNLSLVPVYLTADFGANIQSGVWPVQVEFTDATVGFPNNWKWNFGDGNTSIEQNPKHTYNNTGLYTVELIACNGAVCDTMEKLDYINVLANGIAEISKNIEIGIYPNPNDGMFTVDINSYHQNEFMIVVYNLLGEKVYADEIQTFKGNHKHNLNLSTLPKGIYNIVIMNDKFKRVGMVVIQ